MATSQTHTGDNFIARLRKSASQLEEFQLQLALGKAEAADQYEAIKKKMKTKIRAAKKSILDAGTDAEDALLGTIEELEVQLALGKAETRDQFAEQKKRIFRAINRLDKELDPEHADEQIRHEMETFRIKMELLDLHYSLGAMDARDKFQVEKHKLEETLAKLKVKYTVKKADVLKDVDQRKAELKEAYRHLKKAVTA